MAHDVCIFQEHFVVQDRKPAEYNKATSLSIGLSRFAQPFNSGLCTIDDVIEVLNNCGGKTSFSLVTTIQVKDHYALT